MQRFTDLKVWQEGHALVLEVYRASAPFPSEERYGLTSQIRRAMLSVPTNIAEGSKRLSNVEYARFLNIAEASLAEAEYLVLVSRDLGFMKTEHADALQGRFQGLARGLHLLRSRVQEGVRDEAR